MGWADRRTVHTVTPMTTTTQPNARDDLFTHIHKAIRLGLFEVTAQTGRTDWQDPGQVAEVGGHWHELLEVLRAHTEHEDRYIFALLDGHDPMAVEPAGDAHRDLDDLLDDLAARFEAILARPDRVAGLDLYRDLNRFIAAYLPHLHDEETRIMRRIWECCSDEEIGACRARFMAATTPEVSATSLRLLFSALDRSTRLALAGGMAGAPEPVRAGVAAIAEDVLSADDAAQIRALLAS